MGSTGVGVGEGMEARCPWGSRTRGGKQREILDSVKGGEWGACGEQVWKLSEGCVGAVEGPDGGQCRPAKVMAEGQL